MDSVAVGIHENPTFKLGLRKPDPSLKALELGDFLTGVVPTHPENVDYLQGVTFGMYQNDRFGVCGPTSVANDRRKVTARLKGKMVAPTQEDVFALYRASGNPNFNPNTGEDDNGVNMQNMLGQLLRLGIGGIKCLGFARVNVADIEQLQAAVAIFGGLLLGVDLQKAQQSQTDHGYWDYSKSSEWGGHAVMAGKYESNPETLDVITWQKTVQARANFIRNQLGEAWVVIWPEHLLDKGFLEGVDVYKLAKSYQDLTGRAFPANLPPAPTPTPVPAPTPGVLTIDPVAKKIIYPSGWTAEQVKSKSDFQIV